MALYGINIEATILDIMEENPQVVKGSVTFKVGARGRDKREILEEAAKQLLAWMERELNAKALPEQGGKLWVPEGRES